MIDVHTLSAALAAVYGGSVFFAGILYGLGRRFKGAGLWIGGLVLLAAGSVGVSLPVGTVSYGILAVSNVALLASVLVSANVIWLFRFDRGFPYALYLVVPAALVLWFAMKDARIASRAAVFSGMLAVLATFVTILLLMRPSDPDEMEPAVFRLPAVYYAMVSAISIVRLVVAITGTQHRAMTGSMTVEALMHLVALLAAFFNLFAYFLFASAVVERNLRRSEASLLARNDELTATMKTKDTLMTIIGHDLRTPLWSAARIARGRLAGYDGDLNDKRETVKALADGLDSISSMLDALLEWALCASGRIQLESADLDLDEIVDEVINGFGTSAGEKDISIRYEHSACRMHGDRRAFSTILRNLLSNAVKFSVRGSVVDLEVSCGHDGLEGTEPVQAGNDSNMPEKAESVSAGNGRNPREPDGKARAVRIVVRDHGVGMRPEQLASLFTPGSTRLTLGTAGENGHGFGLAISRQFVQAMGGTMTVDSEPGKGSRFVIDFPIATARAPTATR